MSLHVHVFTRSEGGEVLVRYPQDESEERFDTPAGFESCRWELWGASFMKRRRPFGLGLSLLPRLREDEIVVEGEELPRLAEECRVVLASLAFLEKRSGHDREYICLRTLNILAAVRGAQEAGGGVIIR